MIQIGDHLGAYEILGPIGAGGMGEVYRARDTRLLREVAIKVLPASVAKDAERLQRFNREATTVAAMNHPNIVTIHAIEESGGHHYIAMELVEGKPLDRMIPPGGMPLAAIFDIAIPLADALAAAHDKGIVHRDLKPANVMVTRDGRVKVLDFGLAKLTTDGAGGGAEQDATVSAPLTGQGAIIGTVPYMSPEQLRSEPVDHRTDLFSLGIMLYEMATGQRPFKGAKSADVMSSILRDTPRPVHELNSSLPRPLGKVVSLCLEKEPRDRLQSALDVRNELRLLRREVDSDDASSAPPAQSAASLPSQPIAPPSSGASGTTVSSALSAPTRRGEFWVGVVVVIVAIAGVGWWLGRDVTDHGSASSTMTADDKSGAATAVVSDRPEPAAVPANAGIMLAVLPFKNLGAPDDEYFSDGVSDEIRSRLARVGKLRVISRSSAFQFRNSEKTNRQIGSELGVDYLVDGTIRWDKRGKGESRVRITPELIRISDDLSVWSQPYDKSLQDIFEVQSEIAGQVVDRLKITLLEPERRAIDARPTNNTDAYQAYLRGVDYLQRPDYLEKNYRLAIEMFERAISLDPAFALAYAELGKAHSWMYHEGHDVSAHRTAMAKAEVEKALALEPDSAEAHLALAEYEYRCHRNYAEAVRALTIAERELSGDARVLNLKGAILRRQGKMEEAVENLQRVFALNPLDAGIAAEVGNTYALLRQYEDAIRWYDRSTSIDPEQTFSYTVKATSYIAARGDLQAARNTLETMPNRDSSLTTLIRFDQALYERKYSMALGELKGTPGEAIEWQTLYVTKGQLAGLAYHLMSEEQRASEAYEAALPVVEAEVRRRPDDHRVRSSLGIVLAGLGRKEEAIREGRRAVELFPVSMDAMIGPQRVLDLTCIYTMVGEYDLAMDQIEYLLSIPWDAISIQILRLDPRWDPLRSHPRYESLMRKHGIEP